MEGNSEESISDLKYFQQFCVLTAVELSSESEPEDLEGLSDIDDIKVDHDDIDDLDKLVATTRSNSVYCFFCVDKF